MLAIETMPAFDLLRRRRLDAPQRGIPIARVVAHPRQERDLAREQVSDDNRACDDREQHQRQRCAQVGDPDVRVPDEQRQHAEHHEDVPLERHSHRDRRQDPEVEAHHHERRDRRRPAAVGEEQRQRDQHLDRGGEVRHEARQPARSQVVGEALEEHPLDEPRPEDRIVAHHRRDDRTGSACSAWRWPRPSRSPGTPAWRR